MNFFYTLIIAMLGYSAESIINPAHNLLYCESQISIISSNEEYHNVLEPVYDLDGNIYTTIKIGYHLWLTENLRTTKYNDGSPINLCNASSHWADSKSGAYSWYNNNPEQGKKYGALYNWYAVEDERGICPTGWRVPKDEEWTYMISYIVDNYDGITITNAGNKLKSCHQHNSPLGGVCATNKNPRWDSNIINYGTDDFGFSAFPGGARFDTGAYRNIGKYGYWWSASENGISYAWIRGVVYDYGGVGRGYENKRFGLSVRCIRDAGP